jgi:hypothetical protein
MSQDLYTQHDLVTFAAYRRQFGDVNADNYKTIEDCLYDWKQRNPPVKVESKRHKHDCTRCRYLGTFADKFDMYVCGDSYNIRYGDEGSQYYTPDVRKEDFEELSRGVGGLSVDDTIRLAMIRRSFSFILNNIKQVPA